MPRLTRHSASLQFSWHGINAQGTAISGVVTAASLDAARLQLSQQQIYVKQLRRKKRPFNIFNSIKPRNIMLLTQQLSALVSAGLPIIQCFDVLLRSVKQKPLHTILTTIKQDVASGMTLSKAFAKHPKQFDSFYCGLLHVGEQSSELGSLLHYLALHLEKTYTIRQKIKKALFYPASVLVIGSIVTLILLLKVVPQFETVFSEFHAKLPAFTLGIITVSNNLQQHYSYFLLSSLGLVIFVIFCYRRSLQWRQLVDKLILRIPLIGTILQKSILACFAHTLAISIKAGMPLVNALQMAALITRNSGYQNAIIQAQHDIIAGKTLYNALERTKIFPSALLQIVAAGEETDELDTLLTKAAHLYEQEADAAVSGLSNLIEPSIMTLLGVLIGGLVIAMYLPIFNLGSVI